SLAMHCERGTVTVNFRTMTMTVERHGVLPGAVERLTANIRQAGQLSRQFVSNTTDILRGRLIPYQGLGELIPRFYKAISAGSGPPVPEGLALAVSAAEEAIFTQTGRMDLPVIARELTPGVDGRKIIVTGATGFLGRAVVRRLVEAGHSVR